MIPGQGSAVANLASGIKVQMTSDEPSDPITSATGYTSDPTLAVLGPFSVTSGVATATLTPVESGTVAVTVTSYSAGNPTGVKTVGTLTLVSTPGVLGEASLDWTVSG